MILKLGTDHDVDIELAARPAGAYIQCAACKIKVWVEIGITRVLCAACRHKLNVIEKVRS